jgi:hypothetical protein
MFIYADNFYNGPLVTLWHGLITMTLTQVPPARRYAAPPLPHAATHLPFASAWLVRRRPTVCDWMGRGRARSSQIAQTPPTPVPSFVMGG